METLTIRTGQREELMRLTEQIESLLREKGWSEGLLHLHCPHTTAALTVNEDADPDVALDVVETMGRLVPRSAGYRHAEGNSDAHVKASLFGPGLTLIVAGGRLQLGKWQGVYFCEFDGPRTRRLWAQWIKA